MKSREYVQREGKGGGKCGYEEREGEKFYIRDRSVHTLVLRDQKEAVRDQIPTS